MRKTLLCLAAVAGLTANAQTYTPGAPSQLELTPQSTVVTLTWNWESSSEQTSTAYTDENVADGSYLYSVHAVYDKERSLPAEAKVTIGDNNRTFLPIEASFNGGHLPENWDSYIEDERNAVKDMYSWRFDNYFNLQWPWNSEDFNYLNASVSGKAAGMNKLQAYLSSPAFIPSSDINCRAFQED